MRNNYPHTIDKKYSLSTGYFGPKRCIYSIGGKIDRKPPVFIINLSRKENVWKLKHSDWYER